MSIIIRLQNLPLNAKSGDIRKFFGGLRIPDGGVHILGGDNGDAFIAFMSDEDGRLAMRKDGGKIKDSCVKLFLSSHKEMKHEVEKLAKSSLVDATSLKTCSKSHSSENEVITGRTLEKRQHSRSPSPYNYRKWNINKPRTVKECCQRSRSPIEERIYNSKRSRRRESRSPKRHVTSLRSSSSEYKLVKQEKRSLSPEVGSSFVHEIESVSKSSDQQSVSKSQLQGELERDITEELENSVIYRTIIGNDWNIGGLSKSVKEDFPLNNFQPYQQSHASECEPQNFMPLYDADRQFEGSNFNPRFSVEGSKSEQDVVTPMRKTFFVLLSGLDPQWNFEKVQMILKGFFAPQRHIRFDKNRNGLKTGRVGVKINNKDDYDSILKIGEVIIDGFKITFQKCNVGLLKRLFPREVSLRYFNQNQGNQLYQQSYAYECQPQNLKPAQSLCDTAGQFEGNNFNPRFSADESKSEPDVESLMRESFYVLLSDVNPKWTFRKVQKILKGFLASQGNIRFEKDQGHKTGRVVVKVANKDDYENILKIGEVIIDNLKIKLSKCDLALIKKLFPIDRHKNFDRYQGFCYRLKGIPDSCRYEDIAKFFHGYEIADIVINYRDNGRAIKTGFVCFKTKQDFIRASSQNGKKILHRYIEMLPCSLKCMIEAKNKHISFNRPFFNRSSFDSSSFHCPPPHISKNSLIPLISEKRLSTTQHRLCALLAGLPSKITTREICSFFSKSGLKPDAIHLTVNNNKLSDGRAFVEFSNLLDFDAALKLNGAKLDDNIISVNQIMYDEMVKILDTQKAQHHSNSPIPAVNVPETVPNLSKPSDAVDIPGKPHMANSFKGATVNNSETGRNRFQDELVPSNSHFKQIVKPFNPNEKMTFNEYFNSYGNRDTYSNPAEIFPSSTILQNNDLNMYERMLLPEGLTKEHFPIDSDKNIDISRKISEMFDSFKKYADRIESEKESVGCVVHISNVSISAGTEDVINFLNGFDYFENTLIRRYTDTNEPTNDVRVTFFSRQEAERAVRVLDKQYLHNMAVHLNIL